jgi:hypothetical protein
VLNKGTKKTMDKPTKNKNNYNAEIIERLKTKYGVSKRFITMSLSGDRTSETSTAIKKDYKTMLTELKALLKTL